jgi:hypothetical protein
VSVLGDAYGNVCVGANEGGARQRGLTTVTVTPLDGAAAPTRQPHRLAGVSGPVRTRLLERITLPLTLGGDLGKRRSAQRLALDI